MWQYILVGVAVIAALVFVLRKSIKRDKQGDCSGGCEDCPLKKECKKQIK